MIIGTSLRVEPIASLVDMVISRGIKTVIINTRPTEKDNLATLVIHERAGAFFKRILRRMRVGQGLPVL
jgi:NAD-dependent deacetylase